MRIITALVIGLYLLFQILPEMSPVRAAPQVLVPPVVKDVNPKYVNPQESFKPEAFRMGRGSFRSGRSGYTGGTRSGVRSPNANNPATRTPGAATGRFGGFFGGLFGGLFAGSILGSLLNPFGFGGFGGGGISLIGILFWGVIIYFAFRFVRNLLGRSR
jgi:predicted lipid-binding transport protein (Tim44 family)